MVESVKNHHQNKSKFLFHLPFSVFVSFALRICFFFENDHPKMDHCSLLFMEITLPETNIAPEHGYLEDHPFLLGPGATWQVVELLVSGSKKQQLEQKKPGVPYFPKKYWLLKNVMFISCFK